MIRPIRKTVLSAALGGAALAVTGLAAPSALAGGSLAVRDFVITHAVAGREPIDDVATFTAEDGRAVAFARIGNSSYPTWVEFNWYRGSERHATVSLNVGVSSGWRTWSSVNLRPGFWRVELVDAEGTLLEARAFTVGARPDAMVGLMEDGTYDSMGEGVDSTMYMDDLSDDDSDVPETAFHPMR